MYSDIICINFSFLELVSFVIKILPPPSGYLMVLPYQVDFKSIFLLIQTVIGYV